MLSRNGNEMFVHIFEKKWIKPLKRSHTAETNKNMRSFRRGPFVLCRVTGNLSHAMLFINRHENFDQLSSFNCSKKNFWKSENLFSSAIKHRRKISNDDDFLNRKTKRRLLNLEAWNCTHFSYSKWNWLQLTKEGILQYSKTELTGLCK